MNSIEFNNESRAKKCFFGFKLNYQEGCFKEKYATKNLLHTAGCSNHMEVKNSGQYVLPGNSAQAQGTVTEKPYVLVLETQLRMIIKNHYYLIFKIFFAPDDFKLPDTAVLRENEKRNSEHEVFRHKNRKTSGKSKT